MLDPGLLAFLRASLPARPCRLLEIGAGDGELSAELSAAGYEVIAIDPAATGPPVRPIALHELDDPPESFDAAVAVLSMHHVEPLVESCRRLAEMLRPRGTLILDEIDFERFDERAAGWWLEQHGPDEHHGSSPQEMVLHLRQHCHGLSTMQAVLEEWFELGPPTRGPYLYRWELSPALREVELDLIEAGALQATGARIVGTRR